MKKEDRDFFIMKELKHIAVNGLDDIEAKILRVAIDKIEKRRNVQFDKSLSRASRIVASWPKWKQDCIGSLRKSV